MDTLWSIAGWTLFGGAVLVGLALNIVGLFGNWVILGAMACAWILSGFTHFGWIGLAAGFGLAVLGEVLEAATASYGATRFGGSREKKAMVIVLAGCIGGGVLGTPWLPVVGTLLGACVGAFAAAALYEYIVIEKHAAASMRVGVGAALGRMGGLFLKFFVGIAILLVAALTF